MSSDAVQEEELVVSSSRTPVLRAGYANTILFILAVALVLCNQALMNAGASAWARGVALAGVAVLGLKCYACSLSRLHVKRGQLVLVGPVSEDAIERSEIVGYAIGGIPSSQLVWLKIEVRTSVWPRFRFFVAVSTSAGGYSETKARLETLMNGVLRPA